MWQLLADLAAAYCEAASWAIGAGDAWKACELVDKAEKCLDQRKQQREGEAASRVAGN